MSSENLIPENPLEFIQRCVQQNKLLWTYHVNMRMKKRSIPRQMILDSVQNYKIFAVDIIEDNVRIVTAYHPSLDEWHEDFETRR